jgi:hypothetical protein
MIKKLVSSKELENNLEFKILCKIFKALISLRNLKFKKNNCKSLIRVLIIFISRVSILTNDDDAFKDRKE